MKHETKFRKQVYEIVKKIPYHRLIGSDGRLGGYNKGVDKKLFLLKKEGVKII